MHARLPIQAEPFRALTRGAVATHRCISIENSPRSSAPCWQTARTQCGQRPAIQRHAKSNKSAATTCKRARSGSARTFPPIAIWKNTTGLNSLPIGGRFLFELVGFGFTLIVPFAPMDEEQEHEDNRTWLCAIFKKPKLGVALYDENRQTLTLFSAEEDLDFASLLSGFFGLLRHARFPLSGR